MKDHLFVEALLKHGLVNHGLIAERLLTVSDDDVRRDRALSWIRSTSEI